MTYKGIAGRALGLAILCVLVGAIPSLASGPQVVWDVPLVPVDGAGFVKIRACILLAEVSCEDAECVLSVRQTYQLHNADRVDEAILRVGVPAEVAEQAVRMPEMTLRDEHGERLAPVASDETYGAIWEVRLEPNARATLVLSYVHPPCHDRFVQWHWEMPPLSLWGEVESARIAVELPQYTTDDAFLLLEPYPSTFDGTILSWEYENLAMPPAHDLVMISPPTWCQLSDLRARGAHYELADLYMAMQEAAKAEGIPFPDHFAQILAELEASLRADPKDLDARLDLSSLFRARANAVPEMRLNYLLLSGEELARAMRLCPEDLELADALSRTYYDAAEVASEGGDPGTALTYLRKASQVPGSLAGQEYVNREDLFLRWALSLAEQGMVSEAMAQIDGILSPGDQDALFHYAPPLVSVHTEVELSASDRVARYWFQLYPTSAETTRARLQEVARHLGAVDGCEVSLQLEPDVSILKVGVPYHSVSELQQRSIVLLEGLSTDQDLVTAFVAAPWRSTPSAHTTKHGFLRDSYQYEEHVDLVLMQDVWKAGSEYARWRLIEVRNSSPEDERGQLERRLALIVLREQGRVWERLPSACYWIYRVGWGGGIETHPKFDWLLSWAQIRDLQASYSVPRWARLCPALPVSVGLLALLVAAVHLAKRGRRWPP